MEIPNKKVSNINTQQNALGRDRLGRKDNKVDDQEGFGTPNYKGGSPLALETSKSVYAKNKTLLESLNKDIIFGKKKFSDVLEEIYNNQQKKDKQVTALINELKPLISDIGDATLVVPLIKEYMEISVKNDDILIKMAALAQRAMATTTSDGSLTISDEEKDQLLAAMNELKGGK